MEPVVLYLCLVDLYHTLAVTDLEDSVCMIHVQLFGNLTFAHVLGEHLIEARFSRLERQFPVCGIEIA